MTRRLQVLRTEGGQRVRSAHQSRAALADNFAIARSARVPCGLGATHRPNYED